MTEYLETNLWEQNVTLQGFERDLDIKDKNVHIEQVLSF